MPLIEEMLKAARHKDKALMKDLEHGFPVSGEIDAGGAGLPDPSGRLAHGRPAHGTCPVLSDLRGRCGSVNQRTLASARPGSHAEAVWAKHKQQLLEGKVGPPVAVGRLDLDSVLLVERFGVEEWCSGKPKHRVIDN